MECPEAYLVGSYDDEQGRGGEVCDIVIQKLHASPLPVEVRLFCCGSLNTAPDGWPLATSLAYDFSDGTFKQGRISVFPLVPLQEIGLFEIFKASPHISQ
jgi:hypothetical protein